MFVCSNYAFKLISIHCRTMMTSSNDLVVLGNGIAVKNISICLHVCVSLLNECQMFMANQYVSTQSVDDLIHDKHVCWSAHFLLFPCVA